MRLVDRDDQLATAAMGYAAFRAIAIEGLFPGDAETGFQAVLLVVDAGMDDFAVSRTGRGTDALRRLQHDDLPAGAGGRTRDGQPDDRSEERRGGKEGVRTGRAGGSAVP